MGKKQTDDLLQQMQPAPNELFESRRRTERIRQEAQRKLRALDKHAADIQGIEVYWSDEDQQWHIDEQSIFSPTEDNAQAFCLMIQSELWLEYFLDYALVHYDVPERNAKLAVVASYRDHNWNSEAAIREALCEAALRRESLIPKRER